MTLEQLAGNLLAFLLTLLVFTYLIGDNPFYRIALHLFVGVAAGYAVLIGVEQVLLPRFYQLLDNALLVTRDPVPFTINFAPWLLSALVLFKISPRLAPYGNAALAFMVGVGAAVAVGGAVTGTLYPQTQAAAVNPLQGGTNSFAMVEAVILLGGTILALMYFFYSGRPLAAGRGARPGWLVPIAAAGEAFITTALAALYAGAIAAAFAFFTERVQFLFQFVTGPFVPELLRLLGF